MAARHNEDDFMFGVSSSMRHTHEKPDSNDSSNHEFAQAQSSKTWHLCPFFDHNPRENVHCLGLTLFRQGDLEQHLARYHWSFCPRCNEPFSSAILQEKHTHNEPPCTPQEKHHTKASREKALKKDLLEHREGQDQDSEAAHLYKRLFDGVSKSRMRFPFPPILLPVYYAVTAIIFLLLWASLITLNRTLFIGLSPKFIYELLVALTSLDLQSAHLFIKLTIKLANAHSSEKGLNVSLQGMLRQLFRILGTSLEGATTHGTLPQDFRKIGAVFSSRVRKVLDDNPEQLNLIIGYLETILQVNSDAFDYTHQTEPNVPETQHHTLDYGAPVAAGLDYCLMDLDDSNLQPQ
ncbi:hypothetical protein CFIMG_006389RAa [Ceratocystis fimbriata CBS 114723]|uniref:Uncharacterized protein n=1 Tax=Ceratocystis fimbriata CBS 114723 TaxID=1035309 RepID=A0A2C5WV25_9PEZI|nr:hypothetical protein CFIMG_006389RAa [Ceratocystis fimbriata CBS 114723]